MAKRFTSTEIWAEDWFLEMPNQYKLFWYYMLSHCDHAGIYKLNLRFFRTQIDPNLTSKEILDYFNNGKNRIRVVGLDIWLIEDFFHYQYGTTLNMKNRVHESILSIYKKYDIELTSIRGLIEVKDGVKDKDKDKDIVFANTNTENSKNTIIGKMEYVWKKCNPSYQWCDDDKPALLEIAYKIAKAKGWNKGEVVNGKLDQTSASWENIANFVRGDDFYRKLDLSTLNKKWTGLYQSMLAHKKPLTKDEVSSKPRKKTQAEIDAEAEAWLNEE